MKPCFLARILALACFLASPLAAQSKPNIIFILTDDLGYGDLGVLNQNARRAAGQPAFHTPRLDTMAAQGAVLSRHYCPAPVCAPSRASLLLGVHQGHANVRDNQFDKVLENNHTLGSVLQGAGYATAAIGKWGLHGGLEKAGDPNSPSFPTKRGFDFFFGYLDHSAGHRHYPKENPADAGDSDGGNTVWEMNSNVTSQLDKCYSTDLFAARAKKWITDHRSTTPAQPFFLYLSFTAPHAALLVPTQAYPAGGGLTGGLQWTGTTGSMINTASGTIDTWIHPDYASQAGWSNANKRHATMVRRLDDAVGDLFQLLADLNIDNNTLVVFTSDNGPHNEGSYTSVVQDPRFFRSYAGMDGIKRDTWEAGIRMPTLVRWPASIPAGRVSAHPSQFHDWLPTLADIAGLPAPARSDGVSLRPALTGSGTQRDGLVYVEYSTSGSTPTYTDFESAHRGTSWNQQQVIHIGDYKGIRHNTTSHAVDFKIYNTATDPKETTDLSGQAGVPTQQEFKDAVLRVRRPNSSAARPYDSEIVPPVTPSPVRQGVAWRAFEGDYPWVPSFATLTATAAGENPRPDVSVRTRDGNIGLEFTGYVNVPADGAYTLYLSADTGAFLRLHDMQLLDADKSYVGGTEVSASVNLKSGLHPFTLGYRHGTAGSPAMALSWSSASIAKQAVPAAAFFTDGLAPPIPPVANPDSANVTAGASVLVNVLANDSDDGAPQALAISGVSAPAHGTSVVESGSIRYTPRAGFHGEDRFSYTVTDGAGFSTADIVVTVLPVTDEIWLPLDDGSGTTASDVLARPLGTLLNFGATSGWTTGRLGGALDFDGADDRLSLVGKKGILGGGARTIAFWCNADVSQAAGIRPTMVSWGTNTSGAYGTRCDVNLDHSNAYRLRAEFNGGGMNFTTASRSNLLGVGWVHCAIVIPDDARFIDVQGYLDGLPAIGTYVGGAANTTLINTTSSGDVAVGNINDGSAARGFSGTIDDVRIYPRALGASEIAALAARSALAVARDQWHFLHGGSDLADAAEWLADHDGDGFSSLLEYALGGNPTVADRSIAPVWSDSGGGFFFSYNLRRSSGLVYQAERSQTLSAGSWTPFGTPVSEPHPQFTDFDRASVALPASSAPTGFIRLMVSDPAL